MRAKQMELSRLSPSLQTSAPAFGPIYFSQGRNKNADCCARYVISPAAVSARVMTAPTSIGGRRGDRRDLAWPGDTAIGQGTALSSGAAGGGNAGGATV